MKSLLLILKKCLTASGFALVIANVFASNAHAFHRERPSRPPLHNTVLMIGYDERSPLLDDREGVLRALESILRFSLEQVPHESLHLDIVAEEKTLLRPYTFYISVLHRALYSVRLESQVYATLFDTESRRNEEGQPWNKPVPRELDFLDAIVVNPGQELFSGEELRDKLKGERLQGFLKSQLSGDLSERLHVVVWDSGSAQDFELAAHWIKALVDFKKAHIPRIERPTLTLAFGFGDETRTGPATWLVAGMHPLRKLAEDLPLQIHVETPDRTYSLSEFYASRIWKALSQKIPPVTLEEVGWLEAVAKFHEIDARHRALRDRAGSASSRLLEELKNILRAQPTLFTDTDLLEERVGANASLLGLSLAPLKLMKILGEDSAISLHYQNCAPLFGRGIF